MKESRRETLSAMLDNETDELELRRLLRRAGEDAELAQVWRRYNLAQSLLRDVRVGKLSDSFASDLDRRLGREAAPRRGAAAWLPSRALLGKFAIAATVAVGFFFAFRAGLGDGSAGPRIAGDEPVPSAAAAPPAQIVELDNAPAVPVDPEARQRLLEYIESMRIEPEQAPSLEPIEDSPLFRLVNDLQD